jgi:Domain of unknown function (DUF1877)
MGIEVNYKHIFPWLLGLFTEQPELVLPFTLVVDCQEPGVPDRATIRRNLTSGKPEHLKKKEPEEFDVIDAIKKDMREQIRSLSPENAPRILDEAESGGFSLGKYFQNVQFHISGETLDHGSTLLSRAVTGDKDIGEDEWPYGPPTFLSTEDVGYAAAMLSKISDNQFLTEYSPDDWDKKTTEYALFYFKEFVLYYVEAAKAGHAMLVWAT